MYPPEDDYPEHIEAAIRAFLVDGRDAGADRLRRIASRPVAHLARAKVGRAVIVRVFRRDHFLCRYCQARTIPTPVMRVLSTLYPSLFAYHPNWKVGVTHPAILSRSSVLDHLNPGSHGGDWHDERNLVTACWMCNARKADLTLEQLRWKVHPIEDSPWQGLTDLYPALWRKADEPQPTYHRPWVLAFEPLLLLDKLVE